MSTIKWKRQSWKSKHYSNPEPEDWECFIDGKKVLTLQYMGRHESKPWFPEREQGAESIEGVAGYRFRTLKDAKEAVKKAIEKEEQQ